MLVFLSILGGPRLSWALSRTDHETEVWGEGQDGRVELHAWSPSCYNEVGGGGGGMLVRARGMEVERVTWGLGKGETGQAGAGGLRAGTRLPSSTALQGGAAPLQRVMGPAC